MTVETIAKKHQSIETRLRIALATMERTDVIKELRAELLSLQEECPHCDAGGKFALLDGQCLFCGKRIREE